MDSKNRRSYFEKENQANFLFLFSSENAKVLNFVALLNALFYLKRHRKDMLMLRQIKRIFCIF